MNGHAEATPPPARSPLPDGEPIITRADVDKLLGVRASGPSLLSLYLRVPRDPAQLRELPARADDLIGTPVGALQRERDAARRVVDARARGWLGHTVAIFSCAELGLAEALRLPGGLPERAVFAARPHVRPLLLAIQRCFPYRIVVADQRHAWLLRVAGEQIHAVPDLIEEITMSALGDGGQATALEEPPGTIAAHLRFPLARA